MGLTTNRLCWELYYTLNSNSSWDHNRYRYVIPSLWLLQRVAYHAALAFLLSDTVGFIRKLPTQLVESFKSTLDEVREADILIHVVDISHPNFEDQINVVNQTLTDIKAFDKPMILVFNKIDAYTFDQKEEDDLTPVTKKNLSLDDLKRTWMNKLNQPCLFISATKKENIQEFRQLVYNMVKELHVKRYPHNIIG